MFKPGFLPRQGSSPTRVPPPQNPLHVPYMLMTAAFAAPLTIPPSPLRSELVAVSTPADHCTKSHSIRTPVSLDPFPYSYRHTAFPPPNPLNGMAQTLACTPSSISLLTKTTPRDMVRITGILIQPHILLGLRAAQGQDCSRHPQRIPSAATNTALSPELTHNQHEPRMWSSPSAASKRLHIPKRT